MKKLNEKKTTYFELLKLDGKFVSVDNEGKTGLTENISEAYMLDCKVVEVFKKYLNEKIINGDELIETIKGVQAVQINNEPAITNNEKIDNTVISCDLKYFIIELELIGEKNLFRILPRPFLYDVTNLCEFKWSTRNASGWNNANYEIIIDNEKTQNTMFCITTDKGDKIKKITLSISELIKSNINWILLDNQDYFAVIEALRLLCTKLEEKENYRLKELTNGFIND